MGANLPLVPHYYFDTRDGLERITDDVGLDFDNLPAALDEPTRGLADLAKDALPVLPSRGSFLCRYKIMPNGTRTIMPFYVPGEVPDAHSLHIDVRRLVEISWPEQGCTYRTPRHEAAHSSASRNRRCVLA